MQHKKIWISLLVTIVVLGIGYLFHSTLLGLVGLQSTVHAGTNQPLSTVAIRPASQVNQVSAAGNIALVSQQEAVLQVGGIVTQVAVQAGDKVKPGDVLVSLDSTDLARAVQQAQLSVDSSQAALDKLTEPPKAEDVAAAQANVVSAQDNLAQLQAGPNATQLAEAKTALAAAQAKYQELQAGPSEAQKTQLAASFQKAEVALKQAQDAYNAIAYSSDAGATQQAANLQNATIDYDTAKAAYDVATQPATQSDLETALNAIKTAQNQLDALQPTQAALSTAEAQVATAKSALADLTGGPTSADQRQAEVAVEQAKLSLVQAQTNLERAQLRSPITGTVLAVNVEMGQEAAAGLNAVTLADLNALELTVNVAEVDISKVSIGQAAQITIDALPDQTFSGAVSQIAPASESQSGVVNYAVTVRLSNKDNLTAVRPGMTAVATFLSNAPKTEWLVPTNGLAKANGATTVTVVNGNQQTPVKVIPEQSQGEWTVVQSDQLKAGEKVVGSVTTQLDTQNSNNRPRGFFGGGGGGGRPPND